MFVWYRVQTGSELKLLNHFRKREREERSQVKFRWNETQTKLACNWRFLPDFGCIIKLLRDRWWCIVSFSPQKQIHDLTSTNPLQQTVYRTNIIQIRKKFERKTQKGKNTDFATFRILWSIGLLFIYLSSLHSAIFWKGFEELSAKRANLCPIYFTLSEEVSGELLLTKKVEHISPRLNSSFHEVLINGREEDEFKISLRWLRQSSKTQINYGDIMYFKTFCGKEWLGNRPS